MPTKPATQTSTPSPVPDSTAIATATPTVTAETPAPKPTETPPAPPTRIVVPSIDVDAPVIEMSLTEKRIEGSVQEIWEVPDGYAAGWHETSARVGETGNMVMSGHNTGNGEIFRDLYTLEVGDEITVYSEQTSRTYHVYQKLVLPEAGQPLEVRLKNARYAGPTVDERLTLVTCHPYGSLRNRLIIIARPATYSTVPKPSEE